MKIVVFLLLVATAVMALPTASTTILTTIPTTVGRAPAQADVPTCACSSATVPTGTGTPGSPIQICYIAHWQSVIEGQQGACITHCAILSISVTLL